jgi:hypothetical protein
MSNTGFFDINNLMRLLVGALELPVVSVHLVLGYRTSFVSAQSQFLARITDVLLTHLLSPQLRHFALSLPAMLFNKGSKAFPISDLLPGSLLKTSHGFIVSRFRFPS